MVTNIIYTSDAPDRILIPEGDYSAKTLEINAPNADVENKGQFRKVTINAIAENTYEEHSDNVIYFNAPKGHVVVKESGIATINLSSSGKQDFQLENNGYVNDINVPGQTTLTVGGKNRVPITLNAGAAVLLSPRLPSTRSMRKQNGIWSFFPEERIQRQRLTMIPVFRLWQVSGAFR